MRCLSGSIISLRVNLVGALSVTTELTITIQEFSHTARGLWLVFVSIGFTPIFTSDWHWGNHAITPVPVNQP